MRQKCNKFASPLDASIGYIERLPGVTKIIAGKVEQCKHRKETGHVRIKYIASSGIKATGYSKDCVVDLTIVVDKAFLEAVAKEIARFFSG